MKKLQITIDEIIKLIENTYKIKKVCFMKRHNFEPDGILAEEPDYVEGELE
jgi:hypothetical protein